jgi:glycosyltransferase involved in cell wall biosynthesis
MHFKKIDSTFSPLISIITVVRNGEGSLEETVLSIKNQTYKNLEYIVIDGNSTDKTPSILKKYEQVIDVCISEHDDGIYHAMNKAISHATGSLVGILNAGDIFYPFAIQEIADAFTEKSFDYTFGSVIIEDHLGEIKKIFTPIQTIPESFTKLTLMPAPHMSVFVKRDLINKLDGYDVQYSVSSDYEFLLRLMKLSNNVFILPNAIGVFRLGGISGSFRTHIENFYIFRKHKFPFFISILHTLIYIFKEAIKKIF